MTEQREHILRGTAEHMDGLTTGQSLECLDAIRDQREEIARLRAVVDAANQYENVVAVDGRENAELEYAKLATAICRWRSAWRPTRQNHERSKAAHV